MASFVKGLSDLSELKGLQMKGAKIVLFFWADWHEASKEGGPLHENFTLLSQKHSSSTLFMTAEAEAVPDISKYLKIQVVPTYIALSGNTEVGRLDNFNPPELIKLVNRLSSAVEQKAVDPAEELNKRLEKLINDSHVMLFMKGNPAEPRCGFSRTIVGMLNDAKISYGSFDILSDNEVRQGLKEYSEWPTYPQLYVGGTLIGGLDIIKEMVEEGDLKEHLGLNALPTAAPESSETMQERLVKLINTAPVMLFMKGNPDGPRCGFSRQIVEMLREGEVEFSSFDILEDEDVRQELKTYSDWPTYPQLYVNGDLIGGLDILKEMKEEGHLKEQLGIE